MLHERPRARLRLHETRVLREKDALVRLRDLRNGLLMAAQGGNQGHHELIAAHADERTDAVEGSVVARVHQRLLPGVGVRVIALDERPIDIQERPTNRHQISS